MRSRFGIETIALFLGIIVGALLIGGSLYLFASDQDGHIDPSNWPGITISAPKTVEAADTPGSRAEIASQAVPPKQAAEVAVDVAIESGILPSGYTASVTGSDPSPTPEPDPTEEPTPEPECHPSYEGACLDPNAEDYDCEGGSGDGPLYTGEVTVVGEDVFRLDHDGDGVGCEDVAPLNADAGPDQTVPGPSPVEVQFDGSGSEGDIVTYKWINQFGELRAEEVSPTFEVNFGRNPRPGVTRTFTLENADAEGNTDTDTIKITLGGTAKDNEGQGDPAQEQGLTGAEHVYEAWGTGGNIQSIIVGLLEDGRW